MRTAGFRRALRLTVVLIGVVTSLYVKPVTAQPVDVPPTWGGDIWSRPRLTGDWGGFRDELGKKGIVFDADLMFTPQDVVSGGRNTGGNFWGNADYTLNVDTGKAGLWPGGFFRIAADSGFGSNVFANAGAIVPVNTAALVPASNDQTTALTNATFMQFLSPKFGLYVGKIYTLDSSEQEFYGDYRTQFMNAAFNFPMTLEQVPISTFGGGLLFLPREDIVLTASVLGPNGTPASNDVGNAFSGGSAMVLGSGELTIKPFGLVGHQNLGFEWNSRERLSLTQDPSNIARLLADEQFPRLANPGPILTNVLARFFPGLLVPAQPANRTSSSWAIYYAFDQYLWQPEGDPKRGVGVFFSFGASDGNPNPIQYTFITGVGGKGVVPGRPDDNFGVGFSRTQFSSAFVPFLRQALNLGLNHEDTVEMYYNAALTPWLSLTPDLQIVDPGLGKRLPSSGLRLTDVSTAVIVGLRARARF